MATESLLSHIPGWAKAIERLEDILGQHGEEAREAAATYGSKYEGRRAAMVFDVVSSRQRRYTTRVTKMVTAFEATEASASLDAMAATKSDPVFGLRTGEWATMRSVAAGLIAFGKDRGLAGDDTLALAWAEAAGEVRYSPTLDPYVGAVSGIGPALFAYARMRSGADTLKPDLRVRRALKDSGLDLAGGEVPLLIVGEHLAARLDVTCLVLDQALWWLGE